MISLLKTGPLFQAVWPATFLGSFSVPYFFEGWYRVVLSCCLMLWVLTWVSLPFAKPLESSHEA